MDFLAGFIFAFVLIWLIPDSKKKDQDLKSRKLGYGSEPKEDKPEVDE